MVVIEFTVDYESESLVNQNAACSLFGVTRLVKTLEAPLLVVTALLHKANIIPAY